MKRNFNSITHGKLSQEQVFERIKYDIEHNPDIDYLITVGTDSQTHSTMKIITVITLEKIGKGGKFFYYETKVPRAASLRSKIYQETQRSLDLAKELNTFLYDNNLDYSPEVHVDMGESKKGKTYELVSEIKGWVTAEGFICKYKPDSNTASEIADRLSK